MNDRVLVEVNALCRNYGKAQALKNVSFSLRQGEALGFLGPNGAGKTTTMQIITGNLAPTSGRVTIAGHDLLEAPKEAKASIGYLPEHPPVYRELTVDEYLDYCAALRRIPRPQRRQAREAAKAKCGLDAVGKRLIGNLSKGYQQRVGLAQAIVHMPPVIILDEPTVGLDPIQIREFRELIRSLRQNHAVILSTHILPEVQATCDRVQIINQGNLVLSDTIVGLSRHLGARTLLVSFRRAPDLEMLRGVPGVTDVMAEDELRMRVLHEAGADPTDAVVALASEKNWGLSAIAPAQASLEEIFMQLTATERAPAEAVGT